MLKGMPVYIINGERRSFTAPLTVGALVRELGKNPKALAVEVNREVVPRVEHDLRWLAEGDEIEIVTLVGGG